MIPGNEQAVAGKQRAMVQEGETGKIVEEEDETEHKTSEVWLE